MKAFNPQEYENSPLCGSSIDLDAQENPDRLFNATTPNLVVQHEKPEHRIVIMLKAQGKSNREIAKAIGYSEPWVSQILRQPWARQRLLAEIRTAGVDTIQSVLAATVEDSVFTLIELRDTADEESVRRGAANDLLDRYLGKSTVHVKTESDIRHTVGDIDKVNREIAETERELARLTGGTPAVSSVN